MVISVGEKAAGVLIFTGVVAPLVGLLLRRMGGRVIAREYGTLEYELPLGGPADLTPALASPGC